jgi:peptide/nickel transport system substrate-binding protein
MRAGLCLLALLAGGCSGESTDRASLLWARSADSSTLDPAEVEWGEDAKITQNVFENLVTFADDSVELEGRLAEKWTVSADGKTIAFDLRQGVTFHDGSPFTSEAVVFTFNRLLDPGHPQKPRAIPYAANFRAIEKVAADGPHRAVFTLREPSAVFLHNLALFGAAIVPPGAVRSLGPRFAEQPVGTGPYRFARWDRDQRIVLDRHDRYWGPKPAIPRVIVLPVPSPQTAVQKLQKGEVHVVDHPTLADVESLQKYPMTKVDFETSLNICYLGFNLKKHPYSDLNFRRAVALAIDRRALNRVAYHGLAEPASNIVPPAIWSGFGSSDDYEHNLEKARLLLSKVKLDSGAVELIHMTWSRPYVPEPGRVAEYLKDALSRIGLEVKLRGYDKGAYTQKYKEESHPMVLLGWNADFPDPDNFFYPLLHGDAIGDMNSSFFNDPAFNDAVKRSQSELDPSRRKALLQAAYARYREELPTVPLVHVKQAIALARNVKYDMHPIEYRFYLASFAE